VTRSLILVGATAVALVVASAVEAAAPRYILVSGPGLKRPVLLGNWDENGRLLSALVNARRENRDALARRRRFELALFWGWPERPRPRRSLDANQHGWFYPARGSSPAVVELRVNGWRFPRIAPPEVMRIFARHGVPTRVGGPPPKSEQATLCSAQEIETLVMRFIAAFNGGDLRTLDSVFAMEPDFQWYSTDAPGQRFTPVANDRSSLIPYFAARHARRERLTLRSFRVNGNTTTPSRRYGNFEYRLTRSADDLEPTPYDGKGAAFCYRNRSDVIFVWSMGRA
jgi:hypothetical protein